VSVRESQPVSPFVPEPCSVSLPVPGPAVGPVSDSASVSMGVTPLVSRDTLELSMQIRGELPISAGEQLLVSPMSLEESCFSSSARVVTTGTIFQSLVNWVSPAVQSARARLWESSLVPTAQSDLPPPVAPEPPAPPPPPPVCPPELPSETPTQTGGMPLPVPVPPLPPRKAPRPRKSEAWYPSAEDDEHTQRAPVTHADPTQGGTKLSQNLTYLTIGVPSPLFLHHLGPLWPLGQSARHSPTAPLA